jgi:hypothetical protein
MQVQGQLKHKFDTQTVSDKFKKREFILTTDGSTPYPQHVSFQLSQDKCDLIDQFNEGQDIEVSFNLRGREWNGPQGVKFFNTLDAWRVTAVASSQPVTTQAAANAAVNTNNVVTNKHVDSDPLPF